MPKKIHQESPRELRLSRHITIPKLEWPPKLFRTQCRSSVTSATKAVKKCYPPEGQPLEKWGYLPRPELHLSTADIKDNHDGIHEGGTNCVWRIFQPADDSGHACARARTIIQNHVSLINWKNDAAVLDCEPWRDSIARDGVTWSQREASIVDSRRLKLSSHDVE